MSNVYIYVFAAIVLLVLTVIAVIASLRKQDTLELEENRVNAGKEGFLNMHNLDFRTNHALHSLLISPLLIYVGVTQKQTPEWVFQLTLVLGVVYLFYHLYCVVFSMKREGFLRSNYFMPRSAFDTNNKEPFVPFSYPYMQETDKYFSYHDMEHTRGHNCVMNTSACPNGKLNLPEDANGLFQSLTPAPTIATPTTSTSPSTTSTATGYGMVPQLPVMGRNPANHSAF